MTEEAKIIGNQCRVIVEGTELDGDIGEASATVAPTTGDDAWISLPCADKAELQTDEELREIYCPQPGAKVLTDAIPTKRKQTWKITFTEINLFLWQVVLGMESPDGSTGTITPNSGVAKKVWLEIKQYDQRNDLWVTHTVWALMRHVGTVAFDDNHIQPVLEFLVLNSTENDATAEA